MTRQEYLEKLEKLLENADSKEKEDALAYVNEYFDEASNKNVDEILKELGTPEEFAKNILKSESFKQRITPPEFKPKKEDVGTSGYVNKPTKKSNTIWWVVGGLVTVFVLVAAVSLLNFAFFERTSEVIDAVEDINDIEDRDNIDDIADDIYEDDVIVKGNMIEKIISSNIKSLDMNLNMSSVEIVKTRQNETRIKLIDFKEDEFEVIDNNGKIEIKENIKREKSDAKIVLQVPSGIIPTLKIKNNMGIIDVENIESDLVDIKLNMGEVDLENIKSNTIDVRMDMGDIDIGILGNAEHYSYSIKNNAGETEYNGIELGSVSVNESGGGKDLPRHINVSNNMGDIDIEFHRGRD